MILLDTYDKTFLKPTTFLVISIDMKNLEKYCVQLFKDGFKNPVITTKVHSTVFKEPKLVFTWDGIPPSSLIIQKKMVEISMKKALRGIRANKTPCDINLQLSEDAIQFLIDQTRHVKQYTFGATKEQREISGEFILDSFSDNVFKLTINKDSIRTGDKESASYVESFGTFHTHPYDAYEKYDVCIAWPSADDYLAFLYMYGICYSGFHVVSTLEGIYLISLKKYIPPEKVLSKYFKNKKSKENIEYQHGVDYPDTEKPYCDIKTGKFRKSKINKYVKGINKKGIFNLNFYTWEQCKKPIRLLYAPLGDTCLLSKEQANVIKKLNSF